MLTLHFKGWYQCRLATNPDPTDEPRGVSGTTCIVAGEPPFDRVIRLQNPVCPRWPRDRDVGVHVWQATLDGRPLPDHPLLGARVDLLDNPKYEQQNLVLVTQPFDTPIDPFHLQIEKDGVRLARKDVWDPRRPELTVHEVARAQPELMQRRINDPPEADAPEAAAATGILDGAAYRLQRAQDLKDCLARATDPVEKLALQKRIRWMEKDRDQPGFSLPAHVFLGMLIRYRFGLNGPPESTIVVDPENRLGGRIGTRQEWPLAFWMGAYDVDTLCGYLSGSLSVPLYPNA